MAVQLNCIYRADIRVSASLVSDGHRFFARLRSNRWKKEEEGEKKEENSPVFGLPPPFRFSFHLFAPPFCTHLFVFPFSNVAKILPFFVKYRMLFR